MARNQIEIKTYPPGRIRGTKGYLVQILRDGYMIGQGEGDTQEAALIIAKMNAGI